MRSRCQDEKEAYVKMLRSRCQDESEAYVKMMRSRCQPGFLLFLVRSLIFQSCLDASFLIRFNYKFISTAQIARIPTLPSSEPHFAHLLGCQDGSAADVKILSDVKINAKPSQNEKEYEADVKIMRSRCQD